MFKQSLVHKSPSKYFAHLPTGGFYRVSSLGAISYEIMKASRQNSAFTLFELLVILIVIAFLVCALLPVLARTSQDQPGCQCGSVLEQFQAINERMENVLGRLPG